MIEHMEIKPNLLDDARYDLLFSVENVNQAVLEGLPFRDAYRQIGDQINSGDFIPNKRLNHTLIGSIGNPGNEYLAQNMAALLARFNFAKVHSAFERLRGLE